MIFFNSFLSKFALTYFYYFQMIKEIKEKNQKDSTKWRFLQFILKIVQTNPPDSYLGLFVFTVLSTTFQITIFFKTPFLSSSSLEKGILKLLGENWHELFGIERLYLYIFLIVLHGIGIILITIGYLLRAKGLIKIAVGYYIFYLLLFIPFANLAASLIKAAYYSGITQVPVNQLISQIILASLTSFFLVITTFAVRYSFIPTRSKNVIWKLTNNPQYLRLSLSIIRTFIFTWGKIGILPLLMSLYLQIAIIRIEMKENVCFVQEKGFLITRIASHLVIACHLVAALFYIIKSSEITTKTFIGLIFIILINAFISFCRLKQKEKYLPSCKTQNHSRIYSYYFQHQKLQSYECILSFHQLHCSSPHCYFKLGHSKNIPNIIGMISKMLNFHKYDSPDAQILNQLWCYELNLKMNLLEDTRQFSPEHKFIVKYLNAKQNKAQTPKNKDRQIEIRSKGKIDLISKLSDVALKYESLYSQLKKSRPCLSILTRDLKDIHAISFQINQSFKKMHEAKKLDFTLAQIYSAFISYFPTKMKTEQRFRNRLQICQAQERLKQISMMNLASFEVYPETGKIKKFNKEAIKLLRAKNFELRQKNIGKFLEPQTAFQDLLIFCQKVSESKSQIFFSKRTNGNKNYSSAYITLQENLSQAHESTLFFTLEEKVFGPNQIDILIDSSLFEIFIATRNSIQANTQILDVHSFYKENLRQLIMKSKEKQLNEGQFVSTNLNNKFTVLLLQKEFVTPAFRLFSIKINKISNIEKSHQQRITFSASSAFYFMYDQCQKGLRLTGKKNIQSPEVDESIINSFLTEIQNSCVDKLFYPAQLNPTAKKYSQGIKMYRLYQSELFNIDLEDKIAYEQEFDRVKPEFHDQFYKEKFSLGCYKLLIIFCLLVLLSQIILVQKLFFTRLNIVPKLNQSAAQMQLFSLEFSRLNAVLRDVSIGLFDKYDQNYTSQIVSCYDNLQKYTSSSVFDPLKEYKTLFKGKQIIGNLNQLYQSALNEYHELFLNFSSTKMKNLLDWTLLQLYPLANQQRISKHSEIGAVLVRSINQFYPCAFIFVLFLIFSIIILTKAQAEYSLRTGKIIHPLLSYSQIQIQTLLEKTSKFKQYISLISKKKQLNLQIYSSSEYFQRRKRAKHILSGWRTQISQISLGVISIFFTCFVLGISLRIIGTSIDKILFLVQQEQAIMNSYISLSEISVFYQHSNFIPEGAYEKLGHELNVLQTKSFYFSQQLIQDIEQGIFSNSCHYLTKKGFLYFQSNCSDSQPYFTINNPFQLGILFFLRDQHFNLVNNLTETFASTGIFSGPFASLFTQIGKNCYKQTSQVSTEFSQSQYILFLIMIGFYWALILVFWLIFYRSDKKMKFIEQVFKELFAGKID